MLSVLHCVKTLSASSNQGLISEVYSIPVLSFTRYLRVPVFVYFGENRFLFPFLAFVQ